VNFLLRTFATSGRFYTFPTPLISSVIMMFLTCSQLESEIEVLQQESKQRQEQQDSGIRTPSSSGDVETEDKLKDVLSRAQHVQVRDGTVVT
jgi:hypothetical protein